MTPVRAVSFGRPLSVGADARAVAAIVRIRSPQRAVSTAAMRSRCHGSQLSTTIVTVRANSGGGPPSANRTNCQASARIA
jgi:hypothetical protein